ncbi:GntR family transcriptional repressor for pyruvate dehydrogenase complex [Novosphingobium taihuense]|nr:GntR family transcriptional repressor for pyruvate dehydrogenase complex [Novosphingobium taihuense]
MVIAEALVSETGHIDRVVELEVEFHNLIATASRNILMGHLLESFVPLMREAIPAAWRTRKTSLERQRVHDAHRRVAKAILDKDAKAAEEAMSHHFDDDVYIGLLSYE